MSLAFRHNRLRPATKLKLLAAGILLAMGCAATATGPLRAFSKVGLAAVSSPSVEVFVPRFEVIDRQVYLEGSVRRAFGAKSTGDSCLQVVVIGDDGATRLTRTIPFSPAELPRRLIHPFNQGHYRLPLLSLPAGTSRIEIRAVAKSS